MAYLPTLRDSFLTDVCHVPRHIQDRIDKVSAELRANPTNQHGGNIKN